MGCSILNIITVSSVCRQGLGCVVHPSDKGASHFATAMKVAFDAKTQKNPFTVYVKPSDQNTVEVTSVVLQNGQFELAEKKGKEVFFPSLGLPLVELGHGNGPAAVMVESTANTPVRVVVCEESEVYGHELVMLPNARTVASSWKYGYWFLLLPLFLIPLYTGNGNWRSVTAVLCASDATLWFAKTLNCAYEATLDVESAAALILLTLTAVAITLSCFHAQNKKTRLALAALSWITSFAYTTPVAILLTAIIKV